MISAFDKGRSYETNTPIQEIKDRLRYDHESGRIYWNDCHGKEAGTLDTNGYRKIQIAGRRWKSHRLAWLLFYGEWPTGQIDHINGDKSDNRIANLRDVSISLNGRNRKLASSNTSGISGVYFYKPRGVWRVEISIEGWRKIVGAFLTLEEAIQARKEAEQEFGYHKNHGRFERKKM